MNRPRWTRACALAGVAGLVVGLLLASLGATAGAAPPGQTEVGGTVTATIFGNPISGVVVMALDGTRDRVVASTTTAVNGTYSLLVPSGTGRLLFFDPARNHIAKVSPAMAFPDGGTTTSNVQLSRSLGGIEGRMTDLGSGNGISNGVALATNSDTGLAGGGAATDSFGFWVMRNLRSVSYKVSMFDLAGGHEVRHFAGVADYGSATPVNVVGGALQVIGTTSLIAQTAPTGAIVQGTVTGVGGAPLSDVVALVYNAGTGAYEAGDVTDALGQYSVAVGSGQHKVRFVDLVPDGQVALRFHHLAEWYGDAPDSPTPAGNAVTAPGTADAQLGLASGTIAGTITDDGTGNPLEGVWVFAIDGSGIVSQAVTAADGTYSIPNVPVVPVKVWITGVTGTHLPEYYDNRVDQGFGHEAGSSAVTVTGGATTTLNAGLALDESVAPTATITTPPDNETYAQGEVVVADYACADSGGSGLDTCVGDVADGSPIDTSTIGSSFTFSVTATDHAGNTATVTHNYSVESAVETVATACGSVSIDSSAGPLSNIAASAVPGTPPLPYGVAFPCGLIGFQVDGIATGATVTITVVVPTDVNQYWKLHDGAYTQVAGATFSGNTVTFQVADGGALDDDGIANGTIVDPGGPARVVAAAVPVPIVATPTVTG